MYSKKRIAKMILLGGICSMIFTQCKKEGPMGPAGADGTNGMNANAISAADQAAFDAADGLKGGLSYDEFYIPETGFPQTSDSIILNNADFFRCESCHGADLLGSNGAAIGDAPTETTPNVSSINLITYASSHNIKQIYDAVKHTGGRLRNSSINFDSRSLNSNMPDFGLIMTDGMIWNIVKYLKEKTVNTDILYDLVTTGTYPTGTASFNNLGKDGSAIAGNTFFQANCANSNCHGSTGAIPGTTETVGGILREEPFNAYHIIKYGFPETPMINLPFQLSGSNVSDIDLKNLYKAISDSTAFPN